MKFIKLFFVLILTVALLAGCMLTGCGPTTGDKEDIILTDNYCPIDSLIPQAN